MFRKQAAVRSDLAAHRPQAARSPSPSAAHTAAVVETLESRRFLSATLTVQNLDVLPGFERLIFNRIRNPNPDVPNLVKDRGALKLTNTGDQSLQFSSVEIDGPFMILGQPPRSIAPGKSVNVVVQFTATEPPPFTYNQTGGLNNQNKAGTYIGSLTFATNDPAAPTTVETLAGYYQTNSEDDQEPSLQTLVNLIADYKTDFGPPQSPHLEQPVESRVLYGEEVDSAYWTRVDSSKPVSVRQLATFHTQGEAVKAYWYDQSDLSPKLTLTTDGRSGQSFLPFRQGTKSYAASTFTPGAGSVFGFKIDNEWSDDALNTARPTGGGHHVRFYPVRDHNGNQIANLYFMVMDYSQVEAGSVQNYDFQDNVYLVGNIQPAGN
jgi:hypothetical protein